MATRTSLSTVTLLLFPLSFVACDTNSPSVISDVAAKEKVVHDELLMPDDYIYIESDAKKAETILVVELTIDGVFAGKRFDFPLRRESIYNEDGQRRGLPRSRTSRYVDGTSPDGHGIGYGGSVYVNDSREPGVDVGISFYWTTADRSRGQVNDQLRVAIASNVEQQLSEEVSVKAYFEEPDGSRR